MALTPHIVDETAPLKSVILGIANDFGGTPTLESCYDPKSKEHVKAGTFPVESDLVSEMDAMCSILERYDVEVLRPDNIKGLNQIFSRDISFVIDDRLYIANMISDRAEEFEGIQKIMDRVNDGHVHSLPEGVRAEGGDIMPHGEHLFIGYSEEEDFNTYKVSRTNRAALDFFTAAFPEKKVKGFELNKSDTVAKDNALHLDCCFQPIGQHLGIIYPGGFKNAEDVRYMHDIFGKENLIEISQDEMYHMNSNVFSISPKVVVSNQSFKRLNQEMRDRGLTVEEVPYDEIAKMEGLLRCTTMPMIRG
jgi:N-dimethylarginine dimethylaminohydrolase